MKILASLLFIFIFTESAFSATVPLDFTKPYYFGKKFEFDARLVESHLVVTQNPDGSWGPYRETYENYLEKPASDKLVSGHFIWRGPNTEFRIVINRGKYKCKNSDLCGPAGPGFYSDWGWFDSMSASTSENGQKRFSASGGDYHWSIRFDPIQSTGFYVFSTSDYWYTKDTRLYFELSDVSLSSAAVPLPGSLQFMLAPIIMSFMWKRISRALKRSAPI